MESYFIKFGVLICLTNSMPYAKLHVNQAILSMFSGQLSLKLRLTLLYLIYDVNSPTSGYHKGSVQFETELYNAFCFTSPRVLTLAFI